MSSVDERVVQMRFEDSNFDRNMSRTAKALEDFKSKLNFEKADAGLDSISAAFSNLKLDGIANGVDTIASKFNILGAVGFTAIQKLTEGAIGFGQNLLSNIVDPIVEGGARRAENIAQAKFMLEGLGVAWESIEPAINKAVTGTAYGLDEAAKAAASLSASQVPLDKMEGSLRGIAGVAAMTGSGYSDIAQIFTTVAGNGRLMASELNRIGQRGVNAAAELGKYLGVTEEQARKLTSEGKINFETFAGAMDQAFGSQSQKANKLYSGSLANLRAALARVGQIPAEGKFERLRLIFNALAPQIDNVKDAIKPMLELFKQLSIRSGENIAKFIENIDMSQLAPGFKNLTNGFKNIITGLNRIGSTIRRVFQKAFPKNDEAGTWFITLTSGFEKLTKAMIPSENALENFGTVLSIVAGIISVAWKIITSLWDILKAGGRVIGSLIGLLWDFVKPWLEMVGVADGTTDSIGSFFDMLRNGIGGGTEKVVGFLDGFRDKIEKLRDKGMAGIDFFKKMKKAIVDFSDAAGKRILDFFDDFKQGLENLTSQGGNIFENIRAFFDAFKSDDINIDPLKSFSERVKEIFRDIGTSVSEIWGKISPTAGKILDSIGDFLRGIGEFISGIDTAELLAAGQGVGLIAVLVMVWQHMRAVNGVLKSVSGLLDSTSGLLTGFQENMKKVVRADNFLKIAAGIGILAGALWLLAQIPQDRLVSAGVALAGIALGMMLLMVALDKLTGEMGPEQAAAISAMGTTMLLFAGAVFVLALAVEKLAKLEWEDLAKGLTGVVGLLVGLAYATKIMAKDAKGMFGVSLGIIALATGLYMLVGAVKKFGDIDGDALLQGGLVVAAALAVLSGAMALMSLPKNNANAFAAAAGVLVMVGSLYALEIVMQKFADMSWDEIGRGATVVGGALLVLSGALVILSRFAPNALISAASIAVMAGAIYILALALEKMNDLDPDKMFKNVLALVLVLGALVGAAYLMSTLNGLMGAVSVVLIAAALWVISDALSNLADVDTKNLWNVVAALSVMLIVFGLLALVLANFPMATAALAVIALAIGSVAALLFGFAAVVQSFSDLIDSVVGAFESFVENGPQFAETMKILAEACEQLAPYAKDMLTMALGISALGAAAGMAAIGFGLLGLAMVALGIGFGLIIIFGPLGAVALTAVIEKIVELADQVGPMLAIGGALLVLGGGMIVFGLGALSAALGGSALALALLFMQPIIEGAIPLLDELSDAAVRNVDAILPMIGLGVGLAAFGFGALIGSIGAGALGAALLILGLGLKLLTSVGTEGADILVEMTKKIAGLWTQALKIGAVTLELGALGAAALLMGIGATAGGVGLLMLALGMSSFIGSGPAFATTIDFVSSTFEPAAERIASAIKTLGDALNDTLPDVSKNLFGFGIAAMGAAPAMLLLATGMVAMGAAGPDFVNALNGINDAIGNLSEGVAEDLSNMADTITNGATKITAAITAMATSVIGGISAVGTTFVQVGLMIANSLAAGVAQGMASVVSTIVMGLTVILLLLASSITSAAGLFLMGGITIGMALFAGLVSTSGTIMAGGIMLVTILNAALLSGAALAIRSGSVLGIAFATGLRSSGALAIGAGILLVGMFVQGTSSGRGAATAAGIGVAGAFIGGLSIGMASAAAIGFGGGYSVGIAIAAGATAGVMAGSGGLKDAVRNMANAAVNAAKDELDINSPSRRFHDEIGMQVGAGFGGGIDDSVSKVTGSATRMGNEAIKSMKKSVSGLNRVMNLDVDMSPTIRPVLDLTDIQMGASRLSALLDTKPILANVSTDIAGNHADVLRQRELDNEMRDDSESTGTTIKYEQNVYSPKALATSDIYRQTKSLVSTAKRIGKKDD